MSTATYILPVILVIAAGYGIRRWGLLDDAGCRGVERLSYYVLFPAMVFFVLATADFDAFHFTPLVLAMVCPTLLLMVVCVLLLPVLRRWLGVDGPAFTSFFQGTTRWNSMITLSITGGIHGADGLALVGIAILALVPMVNFASVLALAVWAAKHPPTFQNVSVALLRNPLLAACVIGLAANLLGVAPAGFARDAIELVARSAIGVGLLAIGMGLQLRLLVRLEPIILLAAFFKLLLLPVCGMLLARWIGLSGMELDAVLIALAVPTAASAYPLAREMGGDALLMSRIITVQTTISMLTIPLCLAFLR